jgi:hypothetical protein
MAGRSPLCDAQETLRAHLEGIAYPQNELLEYVSRALRGCLTRAMWRCWSAPETADVGDLAFYVLFLTYSESDFVATYSSDRGREFGALPRRLAELLDAAIQKGVIDFRWPYYSAIEELVYGTLYQGG